VVRKGRDSLFAPETSFTKICMFSSSEVVLEMLDVRCMAAAVGLERRRERARVWMTAAVRGGGDEDDDVGVALGTGSVVGESVDDAERAADVQIRRRRWTLGSFRGCQVLVCSGAAQRRAVWSGLVVVVVVVVVKGQGSEQAEAEAEAERMERQVGRKRRKSE
jgi:alkanesulfonate monooxygenase SsuD/methylene tetrahydromethanopterin reductase-like flavin-dependent oxidoreductase (luciferase family)